MFNHCNSIANKYFVYCIECEKEAARNTLILMSRHQIH